MRKVTADYLNNLLDASPCEKHIFFGKTTVHVYQLPNGFTIVGTSSVVDKDLFDEELGHKYAREDALNNLWPLEGYLLQANLFGVNKI